MKLSLMEYSFVLPLQAGAMRTADVIRFARDVGIDAVELMDEFARDPANQPAIRAALAETGVTIACYDITGDFATADPARHAAAVAAVEAACQRGADLGAPHVLLIPTAPEPGLPVAAVRRAVADGLHAVCRPSGGWA
jgi:sugar phosphate isomerase/epimerase